jgi:biopolymer transport protein ExbD
MPEKGANIFRGEADELRLNLTPMIDAVFLLLIFFMVTTVFTRPHQLQIALPEAVNYDRLKEKKLNVAISAEGQVEINGRLVDMADLAGWLEKEKSRTTSTSLIIKADAKSMHGHVIDAMEIANQVGMAKISVETEELRGVTKKE